MTAPSDKPTWSLADVSVPDSPGPHVYYCRNGKDKITFPDVGAMDWLQAEQMERDFNDEYPSDFLKKWLSEKDYALLVKENLRPAHLRVLLQQFGEHNAKIMGDPGEDSASRS